MAVNAVTIAASAACICAVVEYALRSTLPPPLVVVVVPPAPKFVVVAGGDVITVPLSANPVIPGCVVFATSLPVLDCATVRILRSV